VNGWTVSDHGVAVRLRQPERCANTPPTALPAPAASVGSLTFVIDQDVLERVLSAAVRTGAEFAEVYAEDKRSTTAGLDDGRIEQVTSGRDRGAGIRVVKGDTTGFAHTADLSESGLLAAAAAAAAAASQGGGGSRTVALTRRADHRVGTIERYPDEIPKATKVDLLRRIDEAARSAGGSIVQVSAGYADSRKRILVANTDGVLAGDEQVRAIVRMSVVASGDAGMQTGFQSLGHTMGFEMFDRVSAEDLARDAARQAITKLNARPAPSGSLPVVIKHGTGGVLFHEACGHGLEADLVAKGGSVYRGKQGQLVASPLVTLVDDGTMVGEWGAIGIDDEGHDSQYNVLIENGVLTDYMWDYLRARKDGRPQSGNGRRQSYMHLPMVRMTNTYVLNGVEEPEDIIRDTDYGVYIAKLGGGSVNTATGDFVFGMTEAYLIEHGEITEPLRESNLMGNGPQVLSDIDRLGNDFAMGNPGTCGKDGQGVPVGDGQPTLRVKALTIGGTAS
jgi:TldD protein